MKGGDKVKANQTNFWEIHFPNSKEREEAQSIYKRLSEMFPEKEKALSFIRRLEKCAYLESIDCKEKSRMQSCSGEGYKEILNHYDLTPDDTEKASVFDSEYFNRMCLIMGNVWKINSRVRITLDYDPNFPKSIVKTEFFKD